MRISQGRTHTLLAVLSCAAALAASASTFTVDFNPASPANTNGWDFGTTDFSTSTPGGVRMLPKNKGDSLSIESPVYAARIKAVSLSFKGLNVGKTNESTLAVSGRISGSDQYQEICSMTNIPGTLSTLASEQTSSRLEEFECHQIRIAYTKDAGSLILATVTITDDREETGDGDGDASLSPPTNLRVVRKETDEVGEAFEVSWTLPSGITTSEYQVFEVSTSGGVDESQPVWRETFATVPSRATARQVTAAQMSDWGLSEWGFETVYQKFEGALLVGGEDDKAGSLVTPPFGQSVKSGHWLVVRAHKHDTMTEGTMAVSHISGMTTNLVGGLGLPLAPSLLSLQLPALAVGDHLLLQPRAADGVKNHKTIVDEVAICSDFVPETVKTNEFIAVTGTDETSLTVSTSSERTSLLFRVRSASGDERSDWTVTAQLDVVAASEEDGDYSDGDGAGEATGLAAPGNVRAGTLSDGNVRLGWTTPDGATNVQLRVWTLSTSGGLAAAKADDILWRESFTNAPAAKGNVAVSNDSKFDLYADKGANGWDASRSVQVALSSDASAIKIGTGEKPGAVSSKPLAVSGDGLSLVVTAKRGSGKDNSGVILRPSLLTDAATTNTLGQTTLSVEFAEYEFAISSPLTGTESLLLESVIGTPKDGRIIIDDVALVRGYSSVSTTTNEVLAIDLGASEEYDIAADDNGVVRYAALRAQDGNGATSEWTTPLVLDSSALGEWKPRYLTPDRLGNVDATFDIASLDVSETPFRFLLDGDEWLTISRNKNATTSFSAGVYVCTNVFAKDWLVLTPYSTKYASVVKTAEMRAAIESEEFALRKVSVSGEFAQLCASNNVKRTLLFQWRSIAKDGAATEWHDFGEYKTAYTAADAPSDLIGTVRNVTAEATLRAPAGARVEVRVLSERQKGQKEASLGFRDFRLRAESANRAILIILR